MVDLLTRGDALISDCGLYRYKLTREWGVGPTCVFIMLNPSTADASEDDPTIRRCIGFARREGCGGLRVENLFAFRATDPDIMFRHAHTAVGATDQFIREAAKAVDGPVIAAWGADKRAQARGARVLKMLREIGVYAVCLGMTKSGAPRHPLYVKGDAPLLPMFETQPES